MPIPWNQRLQTIYDFICAYYLANGVSPTYQEIAEGCELSPQTVSRYLDKLEARGHITRELGVHRTIKLISPLSTNGKNHLRD